MSETFDRFVQFLQSLGFKLIGIFDYSQLAQEVRDKCQSPPCSVAIRIPIGRSEIGNRYAIVIHLKVSANTSRRIRRIIRCQNQDMIVEEAIQIV